MIISSKTDDSHLRSSTKVLAFFRNHSKTEVFLPISISITCFRLIWDVICYQEITQKDQEKSATITTESYKTLILEFPIISLKNCEWGIQKNLICLKKDMIICRQVFRDNVSNEITLKIRLQLKMSTHKQILKTRAEQKTNKHCAIYIWNQQTLIFYQH